MSADEGGVRRSEILEKIVLFSPSPDGKGQWDTYIHFNEAKKKQFGVLFFQTNEAAVEAGYSPMDKARQRFVPDISYVGDGTKAAHFYFPEGEIQGNRIPCACVISEAKWRVGQPNFTDGLVFTTQWYGLPTLSLPKKQ